MSNSKPEWISASEAGRMLQKHPQTVKAWVERGFLVGHQPYPHAHHLISLASVERMLDARQKALARLEHQAAEGTADGGDATKIGVNFEREGESGNDVGDRPHKRGAAAWHQMAWATAVTT